MEIYCKARDVNTLISRLLGRLVTPTSLCCSVQGHVSMNPNYFRVVISFCTHSPDGYILVSGAARCGVFHRIIDYIRGRSSSLMDVSVEHIDIYQSVNLDEVIGCCESVVHILPQNDDPGKS